MTELQRYLAEEVAEDHAEGVITRREAMRRLGMLGVGATAAATMLAEGAAAKGRRHEQAPHVRADGKARSWTPVPVQEITFAGPASPLLAAFAPAERVKGGVLVIHENRGLNDHIRTVASRFAASGFSALALDLLSREGGTNALPDDAARMAKLSEISGANPQRFDEDMKAAVTELSRRVSRRRLNAIGFCFGGGMMWRLLGAREPRLSGVAPFYGPFTQGTDLRGNRARVLAVYGGTDARVNATIPAAEAALEAARLDFELLTFTQAGHAFFNDTGANFNLFASQEAWRRVVDWFGGDD